MGVKALKFIFAISVCIIMPIHHAAAQRKAATSGGKINITFNGSGSAEFKETYTEKTFNCAISTVVAKENVDGANWNIVWKNVNPITGANTKASSATFTSPNLRSDSYGCNEFGNPESTCTSSLEYAYGLLPSLRVTKSGKAVIVEVLAQELLSGTGSNNPACGRTSIFNNAIVDGANGINVTSVKIKLTPTTEKKTKKLQYTLGKTYDCRDPAKTASFLSNDCYITTNFMGSVTITGKYKATLVK